MVERKVLINTLSEWLQPQLFKDYCPNGLQVEGKSHIKKIVTGVTASQALVDQAISLQADALLVHHGYFWRGEAEPVVGMKKKRLQALLANDINLLAYHLPLDAHPELGNNAQLAKQLGWKVTQGMDADMNTSIGLVGEVPDELTVEAFSQQITKVLGRSPLVIQSGNQPIKRVAWCTGAAQGFIEKAAQLGVDAYLSGEISEPTVHSARELGIHYFAAGHHATERYGIKALGAALAGHFGLEHVFVDIDNPV
ncbi:Nif3-like dinuclear metal center hexameric protein [Zooshikella marina]|uniref:Nif3-like dinuclear metal center hexameric protein n=1 Tax=Zooshikella ganghwensis TaxID=202772 RepID=UPI001BAEF076|nr:Nif3-like dinuclear metal center hexameric protein [Zooshikella ganghwensis]MBU2705494.1 Nif3-like dinuclear metal center hexameric protein [Zooshikella ganghwensis]